MRFFWLSLISLILFSGCKILDPLNYDSNEAAPNGSIEERHHWGKKNLGASYERVLDWITNAEIVKDNIGNVVAVAPIDKPNFVTSSFTDGLLGNITIEVIGNKERATFSAYGISPCSNGKTCFEGGVLEVKGQEIAVHHTGISLEEFEKPANQIRYLSEKIEFYNRKYPQSKDNPFNSNHFVYKLWSERAEAYVDQGEYNKALSDLEISLYLLTKNNSNIDKYNAPERQNYLERIALYNYYLKQYDQSAIAIKKAIKLDNFVSNEQKEVSYYHLWLWLLRMKDNKKQLANKELENVLQLAAEDHNSCTKNIEISKFLIGEIKEKDLIYKSENNSSQFLNNCSVRIASGGFYANYYAGQKALVNGYSEKGKEFLISSLKYRGDYLKEREIAIYDLDN